MSNPPFVPRWDKLPDTPAEFFELEAGDGRTELKRAYFRLIKQFKPEKHPQEFQRIRAAFEQLDNQMRYGTKPRSTTSGLQEYAWNESEQSFRTHAPGSAQRTPQTAGRRNEAEQSPVRPLCERLANESPESLDDELKRLAEKQPYHFYALAILSDVTQKDDSLAFLRWILAGLKQFPSDPGLFQLLYATIRGPIRQEEVVKLLSAISTIVRDDRFYSLTEPLWDRLIREAPFETFRKLLAKCESNLSDYRLSHKLTFYAHLLKGALWTGNKAWIARAFTFLEEHHQELSPSSEYDVEVLFRLREYLEHREEFVSAHALRQLLDQTIQIYCTGSPLEARNAFLACQLRLVTSGPEVLAAFPINDSSPSLSAFLPLWHMLNGEFDDRANPEDETPSGKFNIRQMFSELVTKTNASMINKRFEWTSLGMIFARFLTYVAIDLLLYLPFDFALDENSPTRNWLAILCLALAGVGGRWTNKHLVIPLWERWCLRTVQAFYSRIWRQELQQFLARTFLSYPELLDRLSSLDDREDEDEYRDWVATFASRDVGLMLFSDAQKFVV